jgi:hypothetical protein
MIAAGSGAAARAGFGASRKETISIFSLRTGFPPDKEHL